MSAQHEIESFNLRYHIVVARALNFPPQVREANNHVALLLFEHVNHLLRRDRRVQVFHAGAVGVVDEALQHGFATAIADTNNSATNTYNSADFTDANLPIPSIYSSNEELSPSLMQRIRNFVQDIINPKPSNTMPENNQLQEVTNERDNLRSQLDQANQTINTLTTERDQARTERDQANHRAEELQALIDQTPTTTSDVNGDDQPVSDPAADFVANSDYYRSIKAELNS